MGAYRSEFLESKKKFSISPTLSTALPHLTAPLVQALPLGLPPQIKVYKRKKALTYPLKQYNLKTGVSRKFLLLVAVDSEIP